MFKFWNRKSDKLPDSLLRESLKSQFPDISCAYLIGQITYSEEAMNDVSNLMRRHELSLLSKLDSIDLTQDIIQIYIIKYESNSHALIAVIDPYDPYMNPYLVIVDKTFRLDASCEVKYLKTIEF